MRFRNFREHVYGCSGGNIQCRVDVGVGLVATRSTVKLRLALAVGFLAMPTFVTGSGRVTWINSNHGDTEQSSLVLNELAKLGESPSAHLGSLHFAEPSPFTDAAEFFDGDTASGVFGKINEFLADNVIRVRAESGFFVADSFHGAATVLSSSAFVSVGHLPTEASANAMVFLPNIFNVTSGNRLPVAGGNDFGNAHIDADKFLDGDRRILWHVNGCQQEEFPLAIDQIALSFNAVESGFLVLAIGHRDYLSSFQCQEADSRRTLEGHDPFVVGHRAVWLEDWAFFFIPLEAFHGFADSADRHLRTDAKFGAKFGVAEFMDRRLAESLSIESNLGGEGSSSIESLHRFEKHPPLFGIRKKLKLERQFHTLDYRERFAPKQIGGVDSSVA